MIKIPVETPAATLRYALTPDEAGIQAIEATFAAYDRMMAILAEVAPVGANLVSLHAQAYERIRIETGLPARLVTLGLGKVEWNDLGDPERVISTLADRPPPGH